MRINLLFLNFVLFLRLGGDFSVSTLLYIDLSSHDSLFTAKRLAASRGKNFSILFVESELSTNFAIMKTTIHYLLRAFLLIGALFCLQTVEAKTENHSFTVGKGTFLLDGKPFVVKAAEVHYPRIPRAYWEHRIRMCKALGMNTLCLYVFWNIHEQREGEFDFSGNQDVAAFCRLAQKHGMYVIVRPGPYVCAEWEMGGLPWWLLKKKDIRLRERDDYFMQRVATFEHRVAEQLEPLSIAHGGPIIMVQVENEYGSYGEDKPYVSAVRDMLRKEWGDKVTLFQCDWASNFTNNALGDLVWTMNFGTGANIDQQFHRLGELRPDAPKMCSEYWSGWFDKWGARHETRPAKAMVDGINEMLSKGISFSLYMTHGGTSFGHWAGANSPGFKPDVTSYDYDAPINEYGQPTQKYWQLREVMQHYADGKLPAVPKAPMPFIETPEISLAEYAPLSNGFGNTRSSDRPLTFEDMDMGWGTMVYTTTLPELPGKVALAMDAHDYAQVYLDGKYVGKTDRSLDEKSLMLPAVKNGTQLKIVVEGMGRINFGRAIKDYKGIVGDVTLTTDQGVWTPRQWTCTTLPDDYATATKALANSTTTDGGKASAPGYYRGYFKLSKVGDTFLNMEAFGKGQVYVNGHALGRFWHIGPQQTLYLPGCWLKKGRNEVVVLDVVGPKDGAKVQCLNHPVIDKLNLEKPVKHNDPKMALPKGKLKIALSTTLKPGNGWQTIRLKEPLRGRYIALQIGENQNGKSQTAIAELYAQDEHGKRINRDNWQVRYADSEQGNHTLDKAFDLQESTYWQTDAKATLPHVIIIDTGKSQTISALEYLPRQEQGAPGSARQVDVLIFGGE